MREVAHHSLPFLSSPLHFPHLLLLPTAGLLQAWQSWCAVLEVKLAMGLAKGGHWDAGWRVLPVQHVLQLLTQFLFSPIAIKISETPTTQD